MEGWKGGWKGGREDGRVEGRMIELGEQMKRWRERRELKGG